MWKLTHDLFLGMALAPQREGLFFSSLEAWAQFGYSLTFEDHLCNRLRVAVSDEKRLEADLCSFVPYLLFRLRSSVSARLRVSLRLAGRAQKSPLP